MVDRMVLSKCWLVQDEIKARTKGESLFWDRFWDRDDTENPGSANSMSYWETIYRQGGTCNLVRFPVPRVSEEFLFLELIKIDISNHFLF